MIRNESYSVLNKFYEHFIRIKSEGNRRAMESLVKDAFKSLRKYPDDDLVKEELSWFVGRGSAWILRRISIQSAAVWIDELLEGFECKGDCENCSLNTLHTEYE